MGLIGQTCTPGNRFSGLVLIGRGLTHPHTNNPTHGTQHAAQHAVLPWCQDTRRTRIRYPVHQPPTHPPHPHTGAGRAGRECWVRCCGGHGGGETPGPFPNPEAKPASAEGTARATWRESRTPPHNKTHAWAPTPTPVRGPTLCLGDCWAHHQQAEDKEREARGHRARQGNTMNICVLAKLAFTVLAGETVRYWAPMRGSCGCNPLTRYCVWV